MDELVPFVPLGRSGCLGIFLGRVGFAMRRFLGLSGSGNASWCLAGFFSDTVGLVRHRVSAGLGRGRPLCVLDALDGKSLRCIHSGCPRIEPPQLAMSAISFACLQSIAMNSHNLLCQRHANLIQIVSAAPSLPECDLYAPWRPPMGIKCLVRICPRVLDG